MKPHRPTERRQLGNFKIARQTALRMAFMGAMIDTGQITLVSPEEATNDPFYVKEGDDDVTNTLSS